jgi:hypothetical protein
MIRHLSCFFSQRPGKVTKLYEAPDRHGVLIDNEKEIAIKVENLEKISDLQYSTLLQRRLRVGQSKSDIGTLSRAKAQTETQREVSCDDSSEDTAFTGLVAREMVLSSTLIISLLAARLAITKNPLAYVSRWNFLLTRMPNRINLKNGDRFLRLEVSCL